MSFQTPILLIVFNRPDKTKLLFNQIKKIKPNKLYISADGPRYANPKDKELCGEVRSIVQKIDWDCDYKLKFSDKNLSCKTNVIDSINWFFSLNEQGIILEDDCIPSKSFFMFCEILLEKYKGNTNVMQINGYNGGFDFAGKVTDSYYFSKLNHTWGWASWKRAWNLFDNKCDEYKKYKSNKKILEYYVDPNIANWMITYFDKTVSKEDNIWSSIWSYSILKQNGLCITPKLNYINNIGFDGSGTSGSSKIFSQYSDDNVNIKSNHSDEKTKVITHPKNIKYDVSLDQIVFYEKIKKIDPRASSIFRILDFFNFYGITKKIKKIFN